ncbi:MAG TPA: ABC transporter permease [Pyrinomonadaceae bacterium]|jgi:lipopolysaccharide transport system permease protein|nr:ABC transporter permease [Pyrinomonadaceae bacterium]
MGIRSTDSASVLKSTAQIAKDFPPVNSRESSDGLPQEPLIVIQPSGAWGGVEFRGLWSHRELLYFLVWRDLKVRYKQTLLGVLWVVTQPLLTTAIFTIFLGVLARVPSDGGVPYSVFVFTGILPWTFFSSAVVGGGGSLVGNANLITKVYFPRLIVPTAAVLGRLVDFAVSFLLLVGLLIYDRVPLTSNVIMFVPLVALMTLMALGSGVLLSALNVKYRDVGLILPILVQLGMYVTPVVYPSRLVFEHLGRWGWVYSLNPMVGIVDGFRAALLGGTFNRFALGVSTVFAVILFLCSAYVFRRVERKFADVI